MGPMLAVPILLIVAIVFAAGYLVGKSTARTGTATALDPRMPAALARRDRFIQHLRETLWQHREIAPALATIALDEIQQFESDPEAWERRQLG